MSVTVCVSLYIWVSLFVSLCILLPLSQCVSLCVLVCLSQCVSVCLALIVYVPPLTVCVCVCLALRSVCLFLEEGVSLSVCVPLSLHVSVSVSLHVILSLSQCVSLCACTWASLAQRSPASSVLAREGAGCGSVGDVPGAWLASAPLWPSLWT